MNKILLITKREYLSRVMKKSFLVMTILGPILIAAFYAIIIYLAMNDNIGNEVKKIAVVDHNGVLKKRMQNSEFIEFTYLDNALASDSAIYDNYYALLEVPDSVNTKDLVIKLGAEKIYHCKLKGQLNLK
jgi:ABC-2 type transport system permease protein